LPKPVVAVVQGQVLGEGAGLATACDLVLAAESATIGYPDIQRGMVPATTLALLRRLAGERLAVDLALSGRLISAAAALAAGLVTHVVPAAELEHAAARMLDGLTGTNAGAIALTKQLAYRLDDLPLAEALELGARADALARCAPEFRAAAVRFLRR
jgi:methylglutaconyl-CoA hydratase